MTIADRANAVEVDAVRNDIVGVSVQLVRAYMAGKNIVVYLNDIALYSCDLSPAPKNISSNDYYPKYYSDILLHRNIDEQFSEPLLEPKEKAVYSKQSSSDLRTVARLLRTAYDEGKNIYTVFNNFLLYSNDVAKFRNIDDAVKHCAELTKTPYLPPKPVKMNTKLLIEIHIPSFDSLETTAAKLLDEHKKGKNVCVKYNGVMLYSRDLEELGDSIDPMEAWFHYEDVYQDAVADINARKDYASVLISMGAPYIKRELDLEWQTCVETRIFDFYDGAEILDAISAFQLITTETMDLKQVVNSLVEKPTPRLRQRLMAETIAKFHPKGTDFAVFWNNAIHTYQNTHGIIQYEDEIPKLVTKFAQNSLAAEQALDAMFKHFKALESESKHEDIFGFAMDESKMLYDLNDMEVYGADIYKLWHDSCGEDCQEMCAVLIMFEIGEITKRDIKERIKDSETGLSFNGIKSAVSSKMIKLLVRKEEVDRS